MASRRRGAINGPDIGQILGNIAHIFRGIGASLDVAGYILESPLEAGRSVRDLLLLKARHPGFNPPGALPIEMEFHKDPGLMDMMKGIQTPKAVMVPGFEETFTSDTGESPRDTLASRLQAAGRKVPSESLEEYSARTGAGIEKPAEHYGIDTSVEEG